MLHKVAGHGAAVFRQFAHQDGFVDTVQFVFLEHGFQSVQGLGRFAEDQHTGSEAVQAMHDEEIKAFEAAAAIGVRDGIRKIGIAAFFRGHREQACGLVHKEQMTILEEHFEIPARAALGFG